MIMSIREQSGVTLIELMIAVALTGLLLAMAVPAMDTFVTSSRQTSTINDFVSSLHVARSTAITTNARVTICPSSDGANCNGVTWNQGWIVFQDPDSDQTVDIGEAIVSTSDGEDDLSILSGDFPLFLTYRPTGRALTLGIGGAAGQFTICDDRGASHAKALIVDLSGRPRVSKTLANGDTPLCPTVI